MTYKFSFILSRTAKMKIYQDNPHINYGRMLSDLMKDGAIQKFEYVYNSDHDTWRLIFESEDQQARFIMEYL